MHSIIFYLVLKSGVRTPWRWHSCAETCWSVALHWGGLVTENKLSMRLAKLFICIYIYLYVYIKPVNDDEQHYESSGQRAPTILSPGREWTSTKNLNKS